MTNWGAQRLYGRFGFRPVGIRRNYYQELHEDALIMWTDDIRTRRLRERDWRRSPRRLPDPVRRSSDHAGHRDLVRRDRRRGGRGRFRAACQPDRLAGAPARAVRRRRARGRGAGARRGAQPVARGGPGRRGRRVRRDRRASRSRPGPGLVGALLVGMAGGEGGRARHGRRPRRGEPSRGPLLGELPGARTARAALRGPDRERRTHDARARAGDATITSCSARRSTTRRARRSTR